MGASRKGVSEVQGLHLMGVSEVPGPEHTGNWQVRLECMLRGSGERRVCVCVSERVVCVCVWQRWREGADLCCFSSFPPLNHC